MELGWAEEDLADCFCQFMVVAWTYAVAVNFSPSYRDTVDKVGESTVGLQESNDEEKVVEEHEKGVAVHRD